MPEDDGEWGKKKNGERKKGEAVRLGAALEMTCSSRAWTGGCAVGLAILELWLAAALRWCRGLAASHRRAALDAVTCETHGGLRRRAMAVISRATYSHNTRSEVCEKRALPRDWVPRSLLACPMRGRRCRPQLMARTLNLERRRARQDEGRRLEGKKTDRDLRQQGSPPGEPVCPLPAPRPMQASEAVARIAIASRNRGHDVPNASTKAQPKGPRGGMSAAAAGVETLAWERA